MSIKFSERTNLIIKEMEEFKQRKRVRQLSDEQLNSMLDFVKSIVSKYEEILAGIEDSLVGTHREFERKRKVKGNNKSSMKVRKHDLYRLDKIIESNKYYSKPKYVFLEKGKRKKIFDVYCIKDIARVFYTAYYADEKLVKDLIRIPDIHYVLDSIRKEKHQLAKYMAIEIPSKAA